MAPSGAGAADGALRGLSGIFQPGEVKSYWDHREIDGNRMISIHIFKLLGLISKIKHPLGVECRPES